MPSDEVFLHRALRLAMNGRGRVEPNPMVGCVLVRDGRTLGEGWHTHFGGPHAEPSALDDCRRRGNSPAGAAAYVTLEPCCHSGKKTPPCAPRLIEAGIARVVVGCLDPNPQVNGNGVAMLRAAGIQVDGPVLEAEARQLIAPFLLSISRLRPYTTLKWAETADGKVAGPGGQRMSITGITSTRLVHQLRSRVDGILVGVNTVLIDDPVLNARFADDPRHPRRFVLDRHLRTPVDARLVMDDSNSTTLFHGPDESDNFRRRRDALEGRGICTALAPVEQGRTLSLAGVMQRIAASFTRELLVEPGPTLARSFFETNLVDRVWVFRASKLGDSSAPSATPVPPNYVKIGEIMVDEDMLAEYLNPQSDAYFASARSADFERAAEPEP